MSRALVTGAGGFVGRQVVETLHARGHEVRAVVRTARADMPDAIALGDLAANPDWPGILGGVDCIVHCAARAHVVKEEAPDPLAAFRRVNRDAALALARAASTAGVRRFIFLSSIGVLGVETRGKPFRAEDEPAPHNDYAIAKAEAEAGLREIAAETGIELVVIRPPLVFGKGARGNLGALAHALRRGFPLPLGSITNNRRDLVSLNTLADLIARCIDHPGAAGETFLVADGTPLSTRAIVERVAAIEGLRALFLPSPPALLRALLTMLGRRALASQLLGDLEVDIAKTRDRLGWRPPAPDEG
jgi:nucleoside-diphosphate-sugar epimerase